ncbi:acyl-CoA dehydrogenase family protein [Burkholderiaceae bacterium FT117]|uniref:acyl-CoA dehydrogenase family protein n=1 Tax=Zeimonas sediminis TaxID=2944268 RepID=UPI002342E19D|nr:acyl-CoA dehydrogenase family protein [Zeimonas sediminis]MCM5569945.1 acyl-CoA dehydrogenase family protein [Zeimonas sediminis]
MTIQLDFIPARIPDADEALRPKIREFIAQRIGRYPAASRARTWMGFDAQFSREMGENGWIGLSLPTRWGGQGRGAFARYVVVEELLAAGAPVSAHWIADRQSGPMILKYGNDTLRERHLPGICRGEQFFCIGMSEPNSGSDLASVGTRARRGDGGWIVNGRKIWTTNAHRSHYMIALVRTSGAPEDRHKGLSQLVIDVKAPGITIRPIRDLAGDEHFNEVFFDDVFVPDDSLIGNEGDGWKQVTAELAFERSGPERILSSIVLLDMLVKRIAGRAAGAGGPAAPALAAARHDIGRVVATMTALRSMSVSIAARLEQGEEPVLEAALVKELGTTLEQAIPDLALRHLSDAEATGAAGDLAHVLYDTTLLSQSFSLRGGTREILRGMIARGLGLR